MYLVRLSAILALGLGVYSLFTALYLWMSFHIHIPIRDTLRLMPFVQSVLEQGLLSQPVGEWLAAHSGAHRITVMRLVTVIDHAGFGGRNHFIYLVTWLSLLALFMVLVAAFRKSYRSEKALLLFISGLAIAFLLSPTQTWNMINPINSTWYVALSASAASIYLVARNTRPPSLSCFIAAYLLAAVAALSNFAGVFILLLLPVLTGLRSVRMGLLSAAISGIVLFLYMRDISTGPALNNVLGSNSIPDLISGISRLTRNVPHLLSKVCLYLGAPLSLEYPTWATALVMSSLLALVSGWITLFRDRFFSQPVTAWFETTLAIATLMFGVALATSMGRGLMLVPTAERYQSAVMLYWLCVCGLMLAFVLRGERGWPWWQPTATALCLAILLILPANQTYSVLKSAKIVEKANRVSALTVMGASENLDYRGLLVRRQPDALANLDLYFKKHNSSYWLDAVTRVDMERPVNCSRVSIKFDPSEWPGIFVASGRIRDFGSQWYRQIPVSTARGEVIGYLLRDFTSKVTPWKMVTGEEDWWKGYVRLDGVADGEVYLHYRKSLFSGAPCKLAVSREADMDAHPGNV